MPKKKSNWASRMKGKIKRHFRARQKMEKETASKKAYAKHYAKAGKHAMTYAQWQKKGTKPVYLRGVRKKSEEALMREAGMTLKRRK